MGRINLIRFAKACKGSGGIITLIAKRLSCERSMVYSFIKREPASLKYLEDAQEEVLDVAETHLINGINQGDKEDVKWFLSRKGRKRGYEVKPEVNITNEANTGPTYKFVIEKPNDIRDTVETEQ